MKTLKYCVLMSVLLICALAGTQSSPPGDKFAKRYRNSDTPLSRRGLCIEAIDQRLISRGMSIESLMQLFGVEINGSGRNYFEPTGGNSFAVHFDRFQGNGIPGDWPGWYLYIEYDEGHKLRNHFLSNDRMFLLPVQAPRQR